MSRLIVLALLVGLTGFTPSLAQAASLTYAVNTTNDITSNGACANQTPGQCSLREAIAEASAVPAGNSLTITVPAGAYALTLGTLAITASSSLAINGAGVGTAISGNGAAQVVNVSGSGPITISNLGVSGGKGNVTDGGGIGNTGTLTLSGVTVNNNSTSYGHNGGGVYNNGSLTLTGSTVSGNHTDHLGAGFYNDNNGTLTLNNSTVSSNIVDGNGAAGGIYNNGTLTLNGTTVTGNSGGTNSGGIYSFRALTLTGSTISNNSAAQAGGIFDFSGIVTMDGSTISGNKATDPSNGYGGGLESSVGQIAITDSAISGNQAGASGGGIFFSAPSGFGGTLRVTNSTISGNSAGAGGGIDIFGPAGGGLLTNVTIAANSSGINNQGSNIAVRNSIVAGSTSGPNCMGPIPDQGYNLESGASCGFTQPSSRSNRDPVLGPLADNGGPTQTMELLAGSPAIDAGGNSGNGCPPTDQRGISRPQGPACDIGAYERAPSVAPSVTGVSPAGGSSSGGTRVAVSGSGFSGATAVHFGPSMAGSFTVASDSSITAVAPAGLVGSTMDVTVSTPAGLSAPGAADRFSYSQPANPPGGPYHPLTPVRILDTRTTHQTLGPGARLDLPVAGQGGVPVNGALAVVLNVAVTDATTAGYLTVFPAGAMRPNASSLNWVAGQTVPNLVEVAAGAGGQVSLFNAVGSVDVVVDLQGWAGPAGGTGPAGLFRPLPPTRIYDSRNGPGALRPSEERRVPVTGQGGLPPSGVSAVVLNVAVTNPTSSSYLTVYPAGTARPDASNLNWVAGETVPNRVIVPVGADGRISLYNALGRVDVVIDLGGWFTDAGGTAGAVMTPLTPSRIMDTRTGDQVGADSAPLGPGQVAAVQVAGLGGVPATGATAVVLNVTVTDTSAQSYLTAYPDGVSRPLASDLNWVSGQTVPNLVIVQLGANGQIDLYNYAGRTDVVIDIVGFYT